MDVFPSRVGQPTDFWNLIANGDKNLRFRVIMYKGAFVTKLC